MFNFFDLPPLLPAEYGAASALKREVEKAIRYAQDHPASTEVIRTYLTIAPGAIPPPAPDPDAEPTPDTGD